VVGKLDLDPSDHAMGRQAQRPRWPRFVAAPLNVGKPAVVIAPPLKGRIDPVKVGWPVPLEAAPVPVDGAPG
jgi:hypothetical protein